MIICVQIIYIYILLENKLSFYIYIYIYIYNDNFSSNNTSTVDYVSHSVLWRMWEIFYDVSVLPLVDVLEEGEDTLRVVADTHLLQVSDVTLSSKLIIIPTYTTALALHVRVCAGVRVRECGCVCV